MCPLTPTFTKRRRRSTLALSESPAAIECKVGSRALANFSRHPSRFTPQKKRRERAHMQTLNDAARSLVYCRCSSLVTARMRGGQRESGGESNAQKVALNRRAAAVAVADDDNDERDRPLSCALPRRVDGDDGNDGGDAAAATRACFKRFALRRRASRRELPSPPTLSVVRRRLRVSSRARACAANRKRK